MLKLLVAVLFVLGHADLQCVESWSLWPGARYWVKVENVLKDSLDVHCASNGYAELGLQHIPPQGQFNWTFRTQFFEKAIYQCNFTWPKHAHKSFTAFEDDQGFVDNLCGGRHCTWKAAEDAIYLYRIYKKKYVKMHDWDKK